MTDSTATLQKQRIVYDDGATRQFMTASIGWGLIGMLVGLVIALQLSFHQLNFDTPWLTFGRLRPLHTNAVIFALVGNMMFAGIYYSSQRLLKTRMASDFLTRLHFWTWQTVILGAAITLPMGMTQSKEYAELEWFLDLLVVVSWVTFAVNFFWTLKIRNERQLYVAIWFYIATIITIAVLYLVNNFAIPFSAGKSYGVFSGAQDALTQWWYGHNAVAFFLTTPILGIMYYFLPKAADRPVYSYRLSIIHFWALVFLYIWAGPHHLLYSALPDWAQSLGMLFSLMLWAPSWGGMLNGLLTLRGAWHKVRTDPVLKFFVAGVTFYGMATFEGPLLSIKSVNGLAHYTDWIIGHVHGGALGWNGFMAAGMFYWLAPRLFGRPLWSKNLADMHFWIGIFGILLYVASMWVAGVTHGLMWRGITPDGGLQYPNWVEIIDAVHPMYLARTVGGALFIVGWGMMVVNVAMTWAGKPGVNGEAEVTVLTDPSAAGAPNWRLVLGLPTILTTAGLVALYMIGETDNIGLAVVGMVFLTLIVVATVFAYRSAAGTGFRWHETLEGRPLAFGLITALAVLAGGVVELLPGIVIQKQVPLTASGELAVKPYTPLELEGRDIYVREGCYLCHSQMIRPFQEEYMRYGAPSRIEESMWDHPFQWGSKRTGPDLAREGDKRGDLWHYQHLMDPRVTSDGSNMPGYPWLADDKVAVASTPAKLKLMTRLGVPYTDEQLTSAAANYRTQADAIVATLATSRVAVGWDAEIVALIAYLQRLGKNQLDFTIDLAATEDGRK